MRKSGLLLLSACALGGCSSIVTHSESNLYVVSPDKALPEGFAYYLPKNMVRVTWERKRTELIKAARDFAQAKAAADEAAVKFAKARAAHTEASIKAHSAPPLVADQFAKEAAIALVNFRLAEIELRDARAAAALAERNLQAVARNPTLARQTAESLLIDVQPTTADTRYRFVLKPVHLPTHDSNFLISVNRRGLLQSAQAVVKDMLPEALANIARAVLSANLGVPLQPVSIVPSAVELPVIPPGPTGDDDESGAAGARDTPEIRGPLVGQALKLDTKDRNGGRKWDCRPPARNDAILQVNNAE